MELLLYQLENIHTATSTSTIIQVHYRKSMPSTDIAFELYQTWTKPEKSLRMMVNFPGASFLKKSGGADTKLAWLFSVILSNFGVNTDKDVWLFVDFSKKWRGSCPPPQPHRNWRHYEWVTESKWVGERMSEWVSNDGSRIFEKGEGCGNGKVTLGLLRLNINV